MTTKLRSILVIRLGLLIGLFVVGSIGISQAQVVNIDPPTGGMDIDGNLQANTPTSGIGDWVAGTPGAGGFLLDNAGNPVDPNLTALIRDVYNTNADDSFTGGSKFNDDPNTWTRTSSSTTGKGDIHNAMYHIGIDGSGDEWVVAASDRRTTTGTSYIDFEFYQNTLALSGTSGFTSAGPDGGRTVNDILLTIEYGSGGSVATVFFYLWQSVPGGFDYVLQSSSSSNAFARTNATSIPVPFGSFGDNTYTPRQFIESAVNLTDVFGSLPDPCIGVSIKTLFIKTKASNSPTASLNDFVAPVQVSFTFGTAEIEYASSPACTSDGPIFVTQTGIAGGTYSAAPAGLSIDPNTGEIDPSNSTPGTYTVTYSYITNGCPKTATTTVTIIETPAPPSASDQEECEENPIQTLTATASVPSGQNVVWYDAATGGNVVATPSLNSVGSVTYYAEAAYDSGACVSESRTAVTLTINPAPNAPSSSGDIIECEEDPLQTLNANDAVTPGVGEQIFWFDAATGGNPILNPTLSAVGSVTYYAESVDNTTNCSSLTRTAVTLTINPAASAPISTGDIIECEENPIQTLDANDAITPTAGQSVTWYDAATGGNSVLNPVLSAVGTMTYYAEGVTDGNNCHSLSRTAVTLTINPAATTPVSMGDITECEEEPIQTLDANDALMPIAGQTVVWYDMATGGTVVPTPTLNTVGSITYYAEGVTNTNNCPSFARTSVTLTISETPAAPISGGDITECEEDPIQTLTATATVPAGQTVTWYDAATGGNAVLNPSLNTVGTVTYWAEAVVTSGGCTSLTRTAVTLTINPAATAPVSTGDITECEEDPIQTLDANDAITPTPGQTVVWYDAATGGNVVASPTLNTV
ncbi:MAG: hypothetical protein R3359_07960, partial [Marinirhabdus sp.]|nr:hypothetical protein [Marinirhabdus sp.]